MTRILLLNASLTGCAEYFSSALIQAHFEGAEVTRVDLDSRFWGAEPLLATNINEGFYDQSDALISLIETHDLIWIASGLYNFKVAASLNNLMDKLVVAGRTFRYTDQGVTPLLTLKTPVVFLGTAGSRLEDLPQGDAPYRAVLSSFHFIGMNNTHLLLADGTSLPEVYGLSHQALFEQHYQQSLLDGLQSLTLS